MSGDNKPSPYPSTVGLDLFDNCGDQEQETKSTTVISEEKKPTLGEESPIVTGEEPNATPLKNLPSRRKYKKESKDRRFSLLITPTLYMRVQRRARKEHLSMNEFINRVLDKHFLS